MAPVFIQHPENKILFNLPSHTSNTDAEGQRRNINILVMMIFMLWPHQRIINPAMKIGGAISSKNELGIPVFLLINNIRDKHGVVPSYRSEWIAAKWIIHSFSISGVKPINHKAGSTCGNTSLLRIKAR
jgi:hypothetical protein